MKILYRYILREHIGPFFFGLAVITFILIMDFIIDVLNLIIGKGLSPWTVLQVFGLNLAWMLALSIPMAVLVSTLMAFGRLSQDNEITAMKGSGVSLYKLVAPPFWASILIALFLIWFNNSVLPQANHRSRILMSEIHHKRPTLNLQPNIFSQDIPGYHILVKKVDPHSSKIEGITIYDKKDRLIPRTIVAEAGEVEFAPDGNTLILRLYHGEIHEMDEKSPNRYRRITFDTQTLYIKDAGAELIRTQSEYRGDREMDIKMMLEQTKKMTENISIAKNTTRDIVTSSISKILSKIDDDTSETKTIKLSQIADQNRIILKQLTVQQQNMEMNLRNKNKFLVEVHKKFSIPFACLVFVIIGAPLGIMAKRGGLAVGSGLSLGFFVLYWAFLIGGEELADRGYISAFLAMWSANIIIGALGIYIIIRSTKETTFISWEWTNKLIPKRFRKL